MNAYYTLIGNDQTKRFKINTQFQNQSDNPSKFITFKQDNYNPSQDKVENILQSTIKTETIQQPYTSHEESLKKMISQSIFKLEEQINHPNGINSFDFNLEDIPQQNILNQNNSESQQELYDDSSYLNNSTDSKSPINTNHINTINDYPFRQISKPINIEEELFKLEKMSEDRTKKINIIELNPKESTNVSFLSRNNIDFQEESKAEELIELKYIDRAPKFSPKIQQMIEEAKKNIEVLQQQAEKEESLTQNKLSLKDQLKLKTESLMQQIENTSSHNSKIENNEINTIKQFTNNNVLELDNISNQPEQQIISSSNNENKYSKKPILNEYDTIFAQFANNNNLRSVKPQQHFSSPLMDTEIKIELVQEEQQIEPQKELQILNPREERLQKYLQKADEVDLNFLENIKLVSEQSEQEEDQPLEQTQDVFDHTDVSYTEQLNLRKNQILQELQQKYNIKATPVQSFEEFKLKVPQDQYPQILYEKYLEQLKKQHLGTSFIETDHNIRSIENSYQLEAAYYEWHLQKNI
ncbi:unnamed protein product [Paramecium sonneborni]|uniref:Uncharacterized protein n=1 Tax=Paramecium sonneborni TaxID=65129 RepID=A0A8S1LP72_9CILI|nr:unnamed protein product [Paramecium sonneborni]